MSEGGEGTSPHNPSHPRDRASDPQLLYFSLNLLFIGISAYKQTYFDSLDCLLWHANVYSQRGCPL